MVIFKSFKLVSIILIITFLMLILPQEEVLAWLGRDKIGDFELGKIKTELNLPNFPEFRQFTDSQLKEVLNQEIDSKRAPDLTHGIYVLSILNEIKFIDSILTQQYKGEFRAYFNNIVDQKTRLAPFMGELGIEGIGDIAGRSSGVVISSFFITSKVFEIWKLVDKLQQMGIYDGLWRYFDFRRNGSSHEEAWEMAEIQMKRLLVSERHRNQLEPQFQSLWNKWGPYVESGGISERAKQQVKSELRATLLSALKEQARLKEIEPPSTGERIGKAIEGAGGKIRESVVGVGQSFVRTGQNIGGVIQNAVRNIWNTVQQHNPFRAAVAPAPKLPKPEEPTGVRPLEIEIEQEIGQKMGQAESEPEPKPELTREERLAKIQEMLDDLAERIDVLNQRVGKIVQKYQPEKLVEAEVPETEEINEEVEETEETEEQEEVKVPDSCLKNSININTASNSDLEKITGIGPVRARRIRELRPFSSLDDLIRVPGIGRVTLQRIKEQGCAYVEVIRIVAGGGGGGGGGAPAPTPAPAPAELPKILISEIQIKGENRNHDFIELYNPNDFPADISGYKLRKRTSRGRESSIRVFPLGSIIPAKGYYLWASSKDENYPCLINADTSTKQTLASNNSIALLTPDDNDTIISALAWGSSTNPFVETSPFPDNPGKNRSLGRIWDKETGRYKNTDNNSADFEIQLPTPKAQNQSPPPREEPKEGATEVGPLSVIINEIAWMGTAASSSDEWIELYNNTNQDINISGWQLKSLDRGLNIIFGETKNNCFKPNSENNYLLPPHSFYLLERTDDKATSEEADWCGSFGDGLHNDGEVLELWKKDKEGKLILIDKVGCEEDEDGKCVGWFAGDREKRISMERIDSARAGSDPVNWADNNRVPWENWQDKDRDAGKNRIYGTPKSKNSVSKSFTNIDPGRFKIRDDFTLTFLGSPYLMEGSIKVLSGAKLTIEPGVIIKFKHHSHEGSKLKVKGELKAIGGEEQGEEQNQKIIFTSSGTQPAVSYWQGIYFKDAQAHLKNVIIKYAGRLQGGFTRGAVYIDGGEVKIEDSLIEKSQTLGIWLKNSDNSRIENVEFLNIEGWWNKPAAVYIESGSPKIENSFFKNNKVGIWIESRAFPLIKNNVFEKNQTPIKTFTLRPTFSGNTARNNNLNGILVGYLGFSPGTTQIWLKADLPYVIERLGAEVPLGKVLNIEPGVIIKFKKDGLRINGTLRAQGTSAEKIVFTSIHDDDDKFGGDTNNNQSLTQPFPGSWDGIYFSPSSANSFLDYVIVRYGGRGWPFRAGAITLAENIQLTLQNSIIENNLYGIYGQIQQILGIDTNTFRNNKADIIQ